jgi:hypothetical protein
MTLPSEVPSRDSLGSMLQAALLAHPLAGLRALRPEHASSAL